jgi:maltooligosyltrehalose trehalohydrolase
MGARGSVGGAVRFAVWAPSAQRVELLVDDGRHLLGTEAGGWWGLEIEGVSAGTRYCFSLDGGPARSDPRSAWQPEGIEGPSAVVDHSAFAWGDGGWRGAQWASALCYECHIGTFTPEGTFDGAIERLDHLVELGVTALEIMPVAEASGRRGWGYDGVSLYAPHHAYGGPDGLKRLVDACHQRGVAVVLDVVYNHFGPTGNYLSEFGPYFTDRYRTPWGSAVNFDGAGSDEVRAFVIDNAAMWFAEYHIDGLRLDAVHAIVDQRACTVLEELAEAVGALGDHLGRNLWLIAESDANDPRLVRSPEAGGYGLDATWNDDFHHALHAVLSGERTGYYEDFGRLGQLARSLREGYVYAGQWSSFRGRRHGRPFGLPGTRLVGYLQNHDQVGNRALGERSSELFSRGRLEIGAAVVACSPFVPLLFQGEEWGASTPFLYFTDHQDPELGRAVSEGRRREFSAFSWVEHQVPDPQDPSTFAQSQLDWSQLDEPDHRALLEWHRKLYALRRRYGELTDGRLSAVDVTYDEAARWLVLRRGRVILAFNLAPDPRTMPLPPAPAPQWALQGSGGASLHGRQLELPPDGVGILTTGA